MSKFRMVLLAATTLAASTLSAQTLRVTVPFEFVAGTTSFPAGQYTVLPSNNVVQIRNDSNAKGAMMLSNGVIGHHAPGIAQLVFHVYGDQYFLSQIWSGDERGRELPPSHAEREQIAAHRSGKSVTVAASLK